MCVGPFARLWHWGPLTALIIIKLVTWMTIHCLSMWWPPWKTFGGTVSSFTFLFFSGCTLYFFLNALWEGPGFVPLGWQPENQDDVKFLQYCSACKGYKAPRSHHCRKCSRCVKKMDHHCPWINGCVGWANHKHFTLFLLFAVLGCSQATGVLSCSLYRAINRVWYMHYGTGKEPLVYLTLTTLVLCLLALGMALGVVLAVGMLLYYQMKSILKNQTAIEDWILSKAESRLEERGGDPFIFPYDLGWKRNFSFVMCSNDCDGITWPLREACNKYDLTTEQLAQKTWKRAKSRLYRIERPYNGRWVPMISYFKAAFTPPCSDEARLPLKAGDRVWVTRWRRHWLFGELVRPEEDCNEDYNYCRGWFPRRCAVQESAKCSCSHTHSENKKTE